MFNFLVSASLRNRLFVLGAALILVIYGAMTLRNLPVDVFPDLNRPIVTLVTEAAGLAPEEVEQLVTFPLETAMNGMPGVVRVRSVSGVGLSIIYIEFDWGTNIFLNRQQVTERLSVVREQLPRNVNPQMAPITSIMGEIMLIAIASDTATPMEVREVVDWIVRPRLLTIPGVAQVIPIGGEVRQYRVTLNLAQMTNLDVTRSEVETALKQFGSNTAGGFVDQHSREYLIRNLARTTRLQDLENLPVAYRKGVAVRLGQVASIDYAARVKRGDAGYMGNPSVILTVQKQPNADTLKLTTEIETALADLKRVLPKNITTVDVLFRQASFIKVSIDNVLRVLVEALVVVAAVLFLFLLNWRTTAISLTAIPISILITVIVFHVFGLSINTMTLGGLAIAIGELVDDAVVGVENVFRRLRENKAKAHPMPVLSVIACRLAGGAIGHHLRHGHHHSRVRAVVCPFRDRGPPVCAAGRRLHRVDPGKPRHVDHRDAGALLLPAAADEAIEPRQLLARHAPQGREPAAAGLGVRATSVSDGRRGMCCCGCRIQCRAAAAFVLAAVQRGHA